MKKKKPVTLKLLNPGSLTCSVLCFGHNIWTLSVKPFENAVLAPCCNLPVHSLGPGSPYAVAAVAAAALLPSTVI